MSFWNFLPAALTIGATLYGANQTAKATDRASQQSTDAINAGTAAQVNALNVARDELNVNRTAASPGLTATQAIIARGAKLTPEQEMAVGDSRAQALNALKGSSLRGSARATSAIVSDTDKRVRNDFMTQNQRAADGAAQGLAGQYFGAGQAVANTAVQQGNAVSQGLTNVGTVQAANTLGQAAVKGNAIGDISAVVADSIKEQMAKERDSSYQRTG